MIQEEERKRLREANAQLIRAAAEETPKAKTPETKAANVQRKDSSPVKVSKFLSQSQHGLSFVYPSLSGLSSIFLGFFP